MRVSGALGRAMGLATFLFVIGMRSAAAQSPGAEAPPHAFGISSDLSPWTMFMNADSIVKSIMIGLGFASLATWTIFFAKSIELTRASAMLRKATREIEDAPSLKEARSALGRARTVLSAFLTAAEREMQLSSTNIDAASARGRLASSFAEIVRAEVGAARRGLGVLATIGATAPFVGLFGTVWGIMNSFIGISRSQTTNLAVVAPGIAEALLATAIGLVAAIPAVVIYNHLSRHTRSYSDRVQRAAGVASRLVSRDLGRLAAPADANALAS